MTCCSRDSHPDNGDGHLPVGAIVLLFLALLTLLPEGKAMTEPAIALRPARLKVEAFPGYRGQVEVTLTNQGGCPTELFPRVMELRSEGEEMRLVQSEECSWFTPQDSLVSLATSESRSFSFLLSVPDSASPGSRCFVLAFVQSGQEGGGIGIATGIASLLEMELLPDGVPGSPPRGPWPYVWAAAGGVILALLVGFLGFRWGGHRYGSSLARRRGGGA